METVEVVLEVHLQIHLQVLEWQELQILVEVEVDHLVVQQIVTLQVLAVQV